MALRVCLLLAMMALASVTQAVPSVSINGAASQWSNHVDAAVFTSAGTCDGPMGECAGEEEEMMESEISRRVLAETRSYISYGALKKDKVPCNRRGQSYYNCQKSSGRTNPYRRGCTVITKCKRFTD